jgi:hypothetical protein
MRKPFLVFLLLALGLISIGCTRKQTTGEHQQFVWHEKRTKPFGRFDYEKITEKAAFDVMENKFALNVPTFVEEVKSLLKKKVAAENMSVGKAEYTMYAAGEEFKVRGFYPVYENNTMRAFALIDLKYEFSKEKKQVRLTSQKLSLTSYGENSEYPQDNFFEVLQACGSLIDIPKKQLQQAIENAQNDYKVKEQRPVSAKRWIYTNDNEAQDKQEVSQTLQVGFDDQQEFREIYAAVIDYTE